MKRNLFNHVLLGPDSGTPGASVGYVLNSAANYLAGLGDTKASDHASELRALARALAQYREDLEARYILECGKGGK